MENEVARNANTHLEHVLERVSGLSPTTHEVLVPFSHEEVEVLVFVPGYDTVVVNTFLVLGHHPPSVSVEGFQQR